MNKEQFEYLANQIQAALEVHALHPVHQAQLLSYLKLADKRPGFLINFNVSLLKDGLKRMVNNY